MKARHVAVGILAVAGLAQLVPVDRDNPPVEAEVVAPPEVSAILRRACWDCHSNETVWGWHTYVAPVSWLAARDVSEGREAMNFSRWNTLDARRLAKLREEIPETVVEEEMPLRLYSLTHPAARLSAADRAKLVAWGRSVGPAGTGAEAPAVGASTSGGEDDDEDHGRRRGGREER
jgi:hypothetical protein